MLIPVGMPGERKVGKEREKVEPPSMTSWFDIYRCIGTGAKESSSSHVVITEYQPKDSEYQYTFCPLQHSVKPPEDLGQSFQKLKSKAGATFWCWHQMVSGGCCMLRSFHSYPAHVSTQTWLLRSMFLFLNPCVVNLLPSCTKSQPCLLISF